MADADLAAKGLPPVAHVDDEANGRSRNSWVRSHIRKAVANPEYYLSVMFTWGHRAAFLLLPIVGLTLALVYANTRRFYIYDHLLVAMNFLSFAFLANAPGFLLPGVAAIWWFGAVALWTPINLYQTLRGAYGSAPIPAAVRTLLVWSLTVFAFLVLVMGLMAFTLTQL